MEAAAKFGQGRGGDYGHFTAGSGAAAFASVKTIRYELVSKQLESQNLFTVSTGSTPYMVLATSSVAVFSTACFLAFLPGELPCLRPV